MEMNEKKYSFINIFLIFGFAFLIIGLLSLCFAKETGTAKLGEIFLILQITFGAILATTAIALTKKGYQLYIGLLFFGWGFFTWMLGNILPFGIKQCWPVYGVIASIFIVIDGLFIYKKIKLGYFFPALVLLCMSILYLLFSFKIIKLSYVTFVYITGPIFIVAVVVFFCLVFAAQKKNKNLILEEDQEAFDEEQLPASFDDTFN